MKYISLFSGIEAATVAWEQLGWEPLAFSEIDPFPSAVLQHHYQNIPNLGDVTKIDWSPYVGAADIVVGGSPCQSFSIAGKREGLAGASGLMFEYIRAVRELRPCIARKYFLSAKACRGIIRRAERRGKPLPRELREALETQIRTLGD